MPLLLGIETSSSWCSVALGDGEWSEEIAEDRPREHHAIILPMIDALLRNAGKRLGQFDAIAFGRGPGSFTGLRIAASITQGLAFGADLPVVAVSSLQALALEAVERTGHDAGEVLVAVDAHMGEIYWGHYGFSSGDMEILRDDGLARVDEFRIADFDVTERLICAGDAWHAYPQLRSAADMRIVAAMPSARQIVRLAARVAPGEWIDAHHAEPVYVRGASVWKKRGEQDSVV